MEAPEHRFLMAVQCHPEELWRKHGWARKLFASFVEATMDGKSRASKPSVRPVARIAV